MILFERGADVLLHETPDDVFLIKPYLPMASIVMLYGFPTLGKTPVAWAMAEAVATSGKFLGVEAQRGNVLFIECDMPLYLVKDRWVHSKPPFECGFSVLFEPLGMNSVQLLPPYQDKRHMALMQELVSFQGRYRPVLVVVDVLRKVIAGDIVSPGIADRVYTVWRTLFPEATILFIHHESKDKDPLVKADPLQKAKGSMEFLDVAQVGMRLEKTPKGIYLIVTKTQASAIPEPRKIMLRDGVYVT